MKTPARNEAPSTDLDINKSSDLSPLRQKTGAWSSFQTKRATSKAAGEALTVIEVEKVQAQKRIALTGLALAETTIRTSLVANAMPKIGALVTHVNAATTAVDQSLTNGAAAEVYTHLSNRTSNVNLVKDLQSSGKIDKEEAAILTTFAQADASEDIERSRQRMTEAKEAVARLHGYAVKNVADSKDHIF